MPAEATPFAPSEVVLDLATIALVIRMQFVPHGVENAKTACETNPKNPGEIPHQCVSPESVCETMYALVTLPRITLNAHAV